MYLQFCRTKAYYIVQHTFLNKAVQFNFQFTLQNPRRLLYVHCKSSLSNLLLVQNVQLLYTQFLVYFINVTTLHICYNVTFFVCFIVVTKLHLFCHNVTDTMLHNLCHNVTGTMLPKSLSQCYYNFFRNLCSPLSHMLLYT